MTDQDPNGGLIRPRLLYQAAEAHVSPRRPDEIDQHRSDPADYDAWYDGERGRWIGETEYRLLMHLLAPRDGERILDVGCGTGWFTRRLAGRASLQVAGIDIDPSRLNFATKRDANSRYVRADALALPFGDGAFDCVCSVTALCFIEDWPSAFREIVRVTRRRFVVGLLNRHSLLWRDKGRQGGTGAYRDAHWHTGSEIRQALAPLPVSRIELNSAVFLPSGSRLARVVERVMPNAILGGAFLVVAGEKAQGRGTRAAPGPVGGVGGAVR